MVLRSMMMMILHGSQSECAVGVEAREQRIGRRWMTLVHEGLLLQQLGEQETLLQGFIGKKGIFQGALGSSQLGWKMCQSCGNRLYHCLFQGIILSGPGCRDTTHVDHFFGCIALKVGTTENDGILRSQSSVDLAKAPAVELAGKAGELGGLEVLGDDGSRELDGVANDKGFSILTPGNAVVLVLFISKAHHVHQLHQRKQRIARHRVSTVSEDLLVLSKS